MDEGLTRAAYALDEGLIDFGAALEALVGCVLRGRGCIEGCHGGGRGVWVDAEG